jgi:hypothetical protein
MAITKGTPKNLKTVTVNVEGDLEAATAHVGQTSPDLTQQVVGTILAKLAFPGGSVNAPHTACVLAERYLVLPTYDGTTHQARVIDCAEPRNPHIVSTIASTLDATFAAIRLDDQTVVLTSGAGTGKLFEVWSLADPAVPVLLAAPTGSAGDQLGGGSYTCCIAGQFLVGARASGDGVVVVWDLSTPATPVQRGTYDTSGTLPGNPSVMTALDATHVAIWQEPGSQGDIHVLSLADPDDPTSVGSVSLDSGWYPEDMALLDATTLAVLAEASGPLWRVYLLDVSDPTAPSILVHVDADAATGGYLSTVPSPTTTGGTVILTTNGTPTYAVYDATGSKRSAPVLLGRFMDNGSDAPSQANLYLLRYPYVVGDALLKAYVLTFLPLLAPGSQALASQHESLAATLLKSIESEVGYTDADGHDHGALTVHGALRAGPTYDLLANRPTAVAAGDKAEFVATDQDNATYQAQNGAWVRLRSHTYSEQVITIAGGNDVAVGARYLPNGTELGRFLAHTIAFPCQPGRVGDQIWFPSVTGSGGYKIVRLTLDGLPAAADITDETLNSPFAVLQVDTDLVWVVNNGGNSISQFHVDGTPAGDPITSADFTAPISIAKAGPDEVWVLSDNPNNIVRLHLDGSSAGTTIDAGLANAIGLALKGAEMWVANQSDATIKRFLVADGSSAGDDITVPGSGGCNGLCPVEEEVWYLLNGNPFLLRLDAAGTVLGIIYSKDLLTDNAGIAAIPRATTVSI